MNDRREELEKEFNLIQEKIENTSTDTPEYVIDSWRKELDSLSFELNNLFDDSDIFD